MSFRLVPKSVTLNDLERRNGRYFAFFRPNSVPVGADYVTRSSATAEITAIGRCVYTLMLYTRLASAVAVCIAIRGRYTQLAWLANPNPNPNPTNSSYG